MSRLALVLLLPAAALCHMVAAAPFTSLTAVRALSAEQAAQGLPVQVEGVVLGLEPTVQRHFFLHDGRAGCFVKTSYREQVPPLVPGNRVAVEGLTDPLGYYPSIREATVRILGHTSLPEPARPTADELFSPHLDSAWVDVPSVATGFEAGDQRATLTLEVYGLPFKAELPLTPDAARRAAALMQRPCRLRGVMGTIFNRQRQLTDRHFFVPSFDFITPTSPAASDGETAPLRLVSELLTGDSPPHALVRIRGVVTQIAPKGFHLRDESGSTMIQAALADRFAPGMKIEAEGYAAVSPFRPILRAISVRAINGRVEPAPIPLDPEQPDLSGMHSELVVIDADFLASRRGSLEGILQFRSQGRFFEALLPNNEGKPRIPLQPGDRVRLTGICELTTTHALPRPNWVDGFRIHLPESGGMTVLDRAPWWTTRRLFTALGLMSGIAALGLAASWTLRRQVKRQMSVISGQLRAEAISEERDRMARELHDTLEQQLSGVALQLDGLDHAIRNNPGAAATSLALARRMLRFTRLEARRSVWDLRSKVLQREGLPAALGALAETGSPAGGPTVEVHTSGPQRPLPGNTDFHLLRIAQEAITNALKHASPTHIFIDLEYLPDETKLVIRDDGRGFDPAAATPHAGQCFGLLGMRERAAKTGALLDIQSEPGRGTTITVSIPCQTATR